MKMQFTRITVQTSLLLFVSSVTLSGAPIRLEVDATDAPRRILHARMHVPAQPGELTLIYPKWLPGVHAPEGPITDLVGLKVTAGNKPIDWHRDPVDMFAFHVIVPSSADAVDVAFDYLLPSGSGAYTSGVSSTEKLLDLSWNEVVLYPKAANTYALEYEPTLRLPNGWKFGTALPGTHASGAVVKFEPVSLETLVDSPVIAGEYFRSIDLSPGTQPAHFLDIVADSAAALEIKAEDVRHFSRLTAEAEALFGAHHFRSYHFLLTLSDEVAHFGLEHHESSDNRRPENYLIDPAERKSGATLLPHEFAHSWNGKYRRPAGLATPDFEQPMQDELLWVYEGLTTYLGNVLATRSGLLTNGDFCDQLASSAAALDQRPGRTWRSLADTTVAAQLLYGSRAEGAAWRRGTDFYPEGALIWLEADTIIRQQSSGSRSLDDFCRRFYGGTSGPPQVVPYTLDDVVAALNAIAAYDWRGFFRQRVYEINPHAPLGGIENAGWHLDYTNHVPDFLKTHETAAKSTDLTFSLGFNLQADGRVTDVLPGSPAAKSGLGAAMKLVAVNGRRWTPENLRRAVSAAATNSQPVQLLVENDDYFKTCKVTYRGGEKYPVLKRDPSKPDLLADILKPLTSGAESSK